MIRDVVKRVSISAEKRSIALGERQRLFARAVRADFTPFPADAVLEAVLRVEGREAARVRLLPVAPGEFQSEIVPAEAGVHEASLETPDAKASASFEVRLPRPEIEDVRADPEALAALARASGGEIIEPERFAEFCRTLAARRVEIPVEDEFPLLEGREWLVFLAILGLLAFEWMIRRLRGLA